MNIHSSKIKHVSPTPYNIFVVVSDSQFQNKGGGRVGGGMVKLFWREYYKANNRKGKEKILNAL